ncbi:hypothetical protein ROHU_002916 [Labeo rohita]|uniref:Uncharacterized protein n=1 Tax=Labeo rohita TaxID=84645 RepID=A0A498NYJ0_LABRO|nr:hypothetical protein ROHU_028493 [Labeo rohita]RXN36477.1 hypothetical protein ROHU_002916 [Labeo rohita]
MMFKWQIIHGQKEITVQYTEGAVTSFCLNLIYRTIFHPLNNTMYFVLPVRTEFTRPASLGQSNSYYFQRRSYMPRASEKPTSARIPDGSQSVAQVVPHGWCL